MSPLSKASISALEYGHVYLRYDGREISSDGKGTTVAIWPFVFASHLVGLFLKIAKDRKLESLTTSIGENFDLVIDVVSVIPHLTLRVSSLDETLGEVPHLEFGFALFKSLSEFCNRYEGKITEDTETFAYLQNDILELGA